MNVLIVGLGSIARKHIKALRELKVQFTLYALRSSNKAEEEEGVINVYSLEEVESINFSFAMISNPTSEHKNTILVLSELNCPLFIEKPLSYSLEMDEVLLKIKNKNILTYVACNLRFLDCLIFVKDYITNNTLIVNEVNVYCGSYLPEWRNSDYKKSYSAIPELGGGAHIDLIHELDYLYWIFGSPEEIHSLFRNVSSLRIQACDYANYSLLYEHFCANVVLNYYRRDYKRTFEIVFENETWIVDLSNNSIKKNEEYIFSSNQGILDTYTSQMSYFMELLSDNNISMNDINEAYNVLKICIQ